METKIQVAALNEQVNTQRQKIHDLENLLVPHKSKPNVEEERSLSYLNNEANNKVNGDINHHSTTKVMADPHQGKMLNSSTAEIEQLRLTEQQVSNSKNSYRHIQIEENTVLEHGNQIIAVVRPETCDRKRTEGEL